MRLSYVSETVPSESTKETQEAYAQLLARRAPGPLLSLDRALLHAPAVASGWSSYFGAIRTQTSLPADIRELCICRVAALNQAEYEWTHHAPILKEAGLDEEAVDIIRTRKAWMGWEIREERILSLTEKQCAVLAYIDAMTVSVKVPDEIFARLKAVFDETGIIEITATVAGYNCVSRFLVALDVGEMNQKEA